MKRIFREPIVQFAVLAVVLFVYFDMTGDGGEARPAKASGQITISETDVSRLIEQYRGVWRRVPTQDELDGLIDSAIREEVLVREAVALGMDQGDAVIRNRLRQKVQFITDSAVQSLVPGDDVLQAYLDANPKPFSSPARLSFDQIYLGQEADAEMAQQVLDQLSQGTPWQEIGQRSLLPPQVPLATLEQIDGTFGRGMFAAVQQRAAEAASGAWVGPIPSGYGLHLVRVTQQQEPTLPGLDEARDRVLFDWRQEQAKDLSEAQYKALRSQYEITVPDADAVAGLLAQ